MEGRQCVPNAQRVIKLSSKITGGALPDQKESIMHRTPQTLKLEIRKYSAILTRPTLKHFSFDLHVEFTHEHLKDLLPSSFLSVSQIQTVHSGTEKSAVSKDTVYTERDTQPKIFTNHIEP